MALGYAFGRLIDVDFPEWLRTLDQVLFYSLSIAAEFGVLLVWWGVVGLTAWPFVVGVRRAVTRLFGPTGTAAATVAGKLLLPTIAFSLLSLMIFPVTAPRHSESPTAFAVAAAVTPPGFGYYTVPGLPCLLGLALMFVVLMSVVGWFERRWRAAGWGLVVGLTIGIAAAGAFCGGLYPAMDAMFARIGLAGSVSVYLTSSAVVTTLPRLFAAPARRR